MKKLFASMTAIALVGAMALPVTAFATTEFNAEGSDTRDVSWTNESESYVIIIPAAQNLATANAYEISAFDLNINSGTTINVTATSGHEADENDASSGSGDEYDAKNFRAQRGETSDIVPYKLYAGDVQKYSGDTVASFTRSSNNPVAITFDAPVMTWYGGTYSDTITFAVSVGTV